MPQIQETILALLICETACPTTGDIAPASKSCAVSFPGLKGVDAIGGQAARHMEALAGGRASARNERPHPPRQLQQQGPLTPGDKSSVPSSKSIFLALCIF
jgi:hypothetical protein